MTNAISRNRITFVKNIYLIIIIYCTITSMSTFFWSNSEQIFEVDGEASAVQISITTTPLPPSPPEQRSNQQAGPHPLHQVPPKAQGLEHAQTLIKLVSFIQILLNNTICCLSLVGFIIHYFQRFSHFDICI